MVSGTEFVDTSPHHAAFGDQTVVHPVASRKGGPHRRETLQRRWYGVLAQLASRFALDLPHDTDAASDFVSEI